MSGISTYIFTQVINCTIHKIKQIYRAGVLSWSIAVIFLHVQKQFWCPLSWRLFSHLYNLILNSCKLTSVCISLSMQIQYNCVAFKYTIFITMPYTDNLRDLAPTFHFQLMQLLIDEVLILYSPKLHFQTYLPNSCKKVSFHQELLVLFWKMCDQNKVKCVFEMIITHLTV